MSTLNMRLTRKWLLLDVKEYEVTAPDRMDSEEVAEAWNFGEDTVNDKAIGEYVKVFPCDDIRLVMLDRQFAEVSDHFERLEISTADLL